MQLCITKLTAQNQTLEQTVPLKTLPNSEAATNQLPDQFTTRKQPSWHVDYASRFNSHTGTHGLCSKAASKETVTLEKFVNLSREISACSRLKVYTGPFPLGISHSVRDNAQVTQNSFFLQLK